MIADPVRVGAYESALRFAIRPDCTVLEIGTGLGFFAVLACELGAQHVYAIEPSDTIEVAREVADANGVADRITFIQKLSTRVMLPQPVDVMFSDLRGILPLWGRHIESIADARERLLRPRGVQIPKRDRVWVAPVEDEKLYRDRVAPWSDTRRGVDLAPASRRLSDALTKCRVGSDRLLASPAIWTELDYAVIHEPNVAGNLEWEVGQDGTAHGVTAWFDRELMGGVNFSTAPDAPETPYGQAFFPFSEPIACAAGDRLLVDLRACLVGEQYIWEWRTRLDEESEDGEPSVSFSQSTLGTASLTDEDLRRGSESYMPKLAHPGRCDLYILKAMKGKASVGEIATRAHNRFPGRFPSYRDALDRVSELSRKHSK